MICHGCDMNITCQKKANPPRACLLNQMPAKILQNGYQTMARQEHKMRMDAIDFSGDF